MTRTTVFNKPFLPDAHGALDQVSVEWSIRGEPRPDGSNVVWVCHALTGNADAAEWWPGLIGEGKLFDPARWCVVCANVLGSCYGTTGPTSLLPDGDGPYGISFPVVTIRDIVAVHRLLADSLGLHSIRAIIGGSLGGHQALEWVVQEPERFRTAVVIASSARSSPWSAAWNAAQRMAIESDPLWGYAPLRASAGLAAARAIAMLSYRTHEGYNRTQGDVYSPGVTRKAESYQRYQGEKFIRRFDAVSYYRLTQAMDSHDVVRDRGEALPEVLRSVKSEIVGIGINTDILFPIAEQKEFVGHVPRGSYHQIHSAFGHDAFLVEYRQLHQILAPFFRSDFDVHWIF